MEVYQTVVATLLPTPAKTHYMFNLRDMSKSKVYEGMLRQAVRDQGIARRPRIARQLAEHAELLDVQRFGDRLDLLVPDAERAKQFLEKELGAAGLSGFELRVDEPTLENAFVATLRRLGDEVHAEPFPGRHDHKDLRGQVAIGAKNLNKQFGSFQAVKGFSLEIKYGEIFGLLGANGAGKTTLMRVLSGAHPADH